MNPKLNQVLAGQSKECCLTGPVEQGAIKLSGTGTVLLQQSNQLSPRDSFRSPGMAILWVMPYGLWHYFSVISGNVNMPTLLF